MNVQIIKTPQGEEMAVLPKADYDKLLEAFEDREDIAAARTFREKLAAGEEELIPAEFVNRMIDGENKIKVWRDYRGMSGKALAENAGISAPYLSQIESGARDGAVETLRKIADTLGVTVDELV